MPLPGKQRETASAKGKRACGGGTPREARGCRMPRRHPAARRTRKPSGSAKGAWLVGGEITVTNYVCGSRLVDRAACRPVFACPWSVLDPRLIPACSLALSVSRPLSVQGPLWLACVCFRYRGSYSCLLFVAHDHCVWHPPLVGALAPGSHSFQVRTVPHVGEDLRPLHLPLCGPTPPCLCPGVLHPHLWLSTIHNGETLASSLDALRRRATREEFHERRATRPGSYL